MDDNSSYGLWAVAGLFLLDMRGNLGVELS